MMRSKVWKFYNAEGFSLIEIAVVFLISGFIMAFSTQFLSIYVQKSRYDKINANLALTQAALEEYFALQGRYPCPADPTLAPTNANYGREFCRTAVTTNCTAGVPGHNSIRCTTTGTRDADLDGRNDTVLIGVVPFRDLVGGIVDTPFAANNAQDAYNMLLTYAVSEKMAARNYSVTNPANAHLGAISIRDENAIEVLDPPRSAHFAIVSHGDNKLGGYSYLGTRYSLCLQGLATDPPNTEPPAGENVVGVAPEKENCDNNDAIFVAGLRSLIEGSSDYYDDSIRYTSSTLKSHWAYSLASVKSNIYNTNIGSVGVGIQNPTTGIKLQVANNISSEVSVGAVKYCKFGKTADEQDCFATSVIAGVGSVCPPGTAAKGIERGAIFCEAIFVEPPKKECEEGKFLVGFSTTGEIHCEILQ